MTLPALRDLIDQHFTAEEIRQLCFDLGIEYENLPGDTRKAKAQALVEYCLRHNRLPDLGAQCHLLRPDAAWPDLDLLAAKLEEVQGEIAARENLAGILSDEELAGILTPLRQKEDGLLAQLIGSGAIAQGAGSIALGERAVQVGEAQVIITGDNNSVQKIIQSYPQARYPQAPTPDEMRRQIGHYLTWLLDWAGTLELRGIQRQGQQVVQLPLQEVYVPLSATVYGQGRQTIDLNNILRQGKRLILVGGPGSGKTTVLCHIAWALAQAVADDNRQIAADKAGFPLAEMPDEQLPLPIFVPLSAYAAHRRALSRQEDRTLAAFISHYLFARQANFDLPTDFFRHLLRQGRQVLLLLDGLDEVPDETERQQVRQAIEDLVTGREKMRAVVTCRTAAYRGGTALGKGFRQLTVEPLANEHINALVEHAYTHLYQHDQIQRRQKTNELLRGIAQLEDQRRARLGENTPRLINSPLLVRMMIVVHYRERLLPEQRAELYMKATDAMLYPDYAPDVETAADIGQLVGGSWELHRDLVQHLAFQMHSRGDNKQGREIEEAELRRLLGDEAAYAPLADDFIALTRLRGTLLVERSGLYQFLHLAFQEYLAARYLAEVVRGEGGVHAIVSFLETGLLLDSWWREVILLVAGYFAVTSPHTTQAFLERLAGIDKKAANRQPLSPDMQVAAAELAAIAWMEWPAQRDALRQALAGRLAAFFAADAAVMRAVKADLCEDVDRTLAQLGAPRSGVGIVMQDGLKLPDIAWGVEVPAGTYPYQSRQVTIQTPYRLSRYPVTYAQFQCFIEAKDFNEDRWWIGIPTGKREMREAAFPFANHPRDSVSWYQAVAFCFWLSDKLGVKVELPHEHEWEVAARYPDGRNYPWDDDFDAERANTKEGGIGQTTAVGLYPSGKNAALELFDLSGNVWEWCRNKYDNPEDDQIDGSNDWRVVRGGSWGYPRYRARAGGRNGPDPGSRSYYIGFRVVVRRLPSHDH